MLCPNKGWEDLNLVLGARTAEWLRHIASWKGAFKINLEYALDKL